MKKLQANMKIHFKKLKSKQMKSNDLTGQSQNYSKLIKKWNSNGIKSIQA